ncbi:MAG: VOC family protein [Bryobacterales bacterium]|nr:VOC family protein [Bryobacterales bacterium]
METGSIGWFDLTVPNAEQVRDFYQAVVGWGVQECDMGGYSDYVMTLPGNGKGVSGVCWAKGSNAGFPPVWLIYVTVADIDASIAQVHAGGGKVLIGPKNMGAARYCVIEDPAGAKLALYQQAPEQA